MSSAFLDAVVAGLATHPRRLPYRWLYDAEGSALFDAITRLPEYYLTRAEGEILAAHGARVRQLVGPATLVELGAGSAEKTRLLLRAWAAAPGAVRYVPVDVSSSALDAACAALRAELPAVTVAPMRRPWEDVLGELRAHSPLVLLYLGSSIGNLEPSELRTFFAHAGSELAPGDHLLLGVDLVKDPALLEAAYDDAAGVTASFTRNLFARMNRELGTRVDLDAIEHVAYWNAELRQIEIYARFTRPVWVDLPRAERRFRIARGEMIRVEISRKFEVAELIGTAGAYGFAPVETFFDAARRFAVLLLGRDGARGAAADAAPATPAELAALQALLDRSVATASPAVGDSVAYGPRQMTAAEVVAFFRRVRLLAMTTVGRAGQPHVAPIHARLCGTRLHFVIYDDTVRRADLGGNPRVAFTTWDGEGAVAIAYGRACEVPGSLRESRPGRSGRPRRVVEIVAEVTRLYAMRPPTAG